MRRRLDLILFAACLLQQSAAGVAATPAEAPPQSIVALQERLGRILKQHHLPGAGVALFNRDGLIWAGGVGLADVAANKPVTADTLFRAGSITKSFVALALLQLAEQRRLDLDARLRDIAPELPVQNPWDATDPVTVAEVLEHTAGFDDMHFARFYDFSEAPDLPLLTVIRRSTRELQVRWRPGTRVSYSNDDYLVAGYLLEKLSGEPYERYLTEHVLRPLGMTHASLQFDAATRAGLAQGYSGEDQHPVTPVQIYLRPAGALNISPAELAELGVLLLNRGQWHNMPFLRAASITRMETPVTGLAAKHGLDYGYGLADYTSYIGGYEFHGHDGGIDGFVSRYAYAPDQGVGLVLLLNTDSAGGARREMLDLMVAYLMRGQPQPVLPQAVAADAATLAGVRGWYRDENPRNQILAVVNYLLGIVHVVPDGEGGLLLKSLSGDPDRLLPAGTGLWREAEHPGPDSVSYTDAGGHQVLDFEPAGGGEWLVQTNFFAACGPLCLFCTALLLLLSSLVSTPVWMVLRLLGRLRGPAHWPLRLLPCAAALAFGAMCVSLIGIEPVALGTANPRTVIYCIASVLFAVLSAAGLIEAARVFRTPLHPWLRWHALAASAAGFGLAVFLASWGLIGLMTWKF